MTANQKQNGIGIYLRMLLCVVLAALVRVVALAPLACLFVFDGWLRVLAVLCPVLVIFVVLPMRYSFAQAMADMPRSFAFGKAFSFSDYGDKLKAALAHALRVAKWGIPLAAMLAGLVYVFKTTEWLDLYEIVNETGDACAALLSSLCGLFGGSCAVTANNFVAGVAVFGAIVGIGVLILFYGVARNSASRYIWAYAREHGRHPRLEMRSRLKGRRVAQLGIALVNLVLLLPFLCVIVGAVKSSLGDVATVLMMSMMTRSLPLGDLLGAVAPVTIAFGALYLPLLPVRRWLTAVFALGQPRAKAGRKASA
ncbi:MAG: hypothetical protein IKK75_14640 [Clostridia bacterium]|nr:hypothetical protein [Clostridia bacterium]